MFDREMNPQNEGGKKRDLAGVWEKIFGTRGSRIGNKKNSTRSQQQEEEIVILPHQYPRPNPRRKEKPSIWRPEGGIHGEARHLGYRVQNCIRMQCGVTTPRKKEGKKEQNDNDAEKGKRRRRDSPSQPRALIESDP